MDIEFVAAGAALSPKTALARLVYEGAALDGALSQAAAASRFTGAKGQTLAVLGQPRLGRLLLLGVGKARELDERTAETLGGMIAADANAAGQTSVTVVVDAVKGTKLTPGQVAAHIALGAQLRNYRFEKYKTKDKPEQKNSLASLTVVLAGPAEARSPSWA
jgi:leucyl aminopeptidase